MHERRKKISAVPLLRRPRRTPHPMTAINKKKSAAKLSPTIIKQRRETIEKRILKLEGKLNKDRALLLRYTDEEPSAE